MATLMIMQSSVPRSIPVPIAAAKPRANSVLPGKTNLLCSKPMGSTVESTGGRSRRDRPCDACRKRKSRCVIHESSKICVLCEFHKQDCTFVQSPQPRKRRLTSDGKEEVNKRRSPENGSKSRAGGALQQTSSDPSGATTNAAPDAVSPTDGSTRLKETLGLQSDRHSKYIGATTELEPALVDLSGLDRSDEGMVSRRTVRKVSDIDRFLMLPDEGTSHHGDEIQDLDEIERTISPHGPVLLKVYFDTVHLNFPILQKKVFLEKYRRSYREFSPPLLAAVYILALNWWARTPDLASLPKPNVQRLEEIALRSIGYVINRPKLSTVQAGLLLLQRLNEDSWNLTTQLVGISQDLGLHLDCTDWRIPTWERGLRKRLAWGLYMQDKWSSLVHGRPSHIFDVNWAVRSITDEDFADTAADEDGTDVFELERGTMLFRQMIALTEILSEVMDTFYTLKAYRDIESVGKNGTRLILERAKPVQIKLKEWFARLPSCLRMDSINEGKRSSTGYLQLAYFATEITLHRRIVRSLDSATTDPYLLHICRAAAKTRLISAMDFINRLKPEHLQSFWYFASRVNFALIGTFGSLLWASAPGREEAEFYKHRLGEYRWTLMVSSKGADFLDFAVGMLDSSTDLLKNLGEKPLLSVAKATQPATRPFKNASVSPPEDQFMTDAQPLYSNQNEGGRHSYDGLPSASLDQSSLDSASGLVSPSISTSSGEEGYEAYTAPVGNYGMEESYEFLAGTGAWHR
ncbi:MAG: Fungal specific transcription factor [Pycnora praestabilis]|nr:MAG: Fungal specific transcription factor [Pycnora praestabilis]